MICETGRRRQGCKFVVCPCFEQVLWCLNVELLFCFKLKLLPLFIFYSGFKLNFSHWLLSSPSFDLTDDSAAWWEATPRPLIPLVALLSR